MDFAQKFAKKSHNLLRLLLHGKSKSNLSLSLGSGPVTVPKTRSACSAWKIWTAPTSSAISRVRTLLSEFARSALCICKENGWHVMKTEGEAVGSKCKKYCSSTFFHGKGNMSKLISFGVVFLKHLTGMLQLFYALIKSNNPCPVAFVS